jgi:3-hydroxyisobutyrate dehydrogenase-like beta-hydroxyacid dehydrogenase
MIGLGRMSAKMATGLRGGDNGDRYAAVVYDRSAPAIAAAVGHAIKPEAAGVR